MGSWCYEDVYQEYSELDWHGAFWAFVKRIRTMLEAHPALVIEGCFLPGSVTRGWLLDDMKVAGVNEVRDLWAPFDVCQGRSAARFVRGETSAAGTGRRQCHSTPGGALPVRVAYLPDQERVGEQGPGQHDRQFRRDLGYGCPARE